MHKIFYKEIDTNRNEATDKRELNYLYIFYLICILIVLVSATYFVIINFFSEDRGTFGDAFGGLTSVFSGFAFAGVIITIVMQMKELQLTRKEMELTRQEITKSTEAQEKSQQALNKQLASMETSSNIDSLIYYLDQKLHTYSEDIYVARIIIKNLTEKLFDKEEYIQYLKPELMLLSETFRPQQNIYIYEIENIGLHITEFEVYSDQSDIELTLSRNEFTYGERLELISNMSLRDKSIYFTMSDNRFWESWETRLYIPPGEEMKGKFIDTKKV